LTLGTAANTNTVNTYSASSGGVSGASVPTSADSFLADANSFTAASQVVTVDATLNCLNLDWTGATNTPTLALGTADILMYGSLTFIANMAHSATTRYIYFNNIVPVNATFAGAITERITVQGVGGVTFTDNLINNNVFTFVRGDLTIQNMTVSSVIMSGANAMSLIPGNYTISCTSWSNTSSNLTVTANTATINISGTGALAGGAVNYNGTTFNLNGTAHTVSGAFTCANLTRTGTATNANTTTFTSGTTVTVTGTANFAGNSRINQMLVQSSVLGTAAAITAGTFTATFTDFMDITATNAVNLSAQVDIGDAGGNTGITFPAGATQNFTNVAGGSWSTVGNWTSRIPLPQDDVTITTAFQTAKTITVDMPRIGKSIDFSGMSWTGTATTVSLSQDITLFGSLTLKTGINYTNTGKEHHFKGRVAYTLTQAGAIFWADTFIEAPGGIITLQDALTVTSSSGLVVTSGTLDTNNQSVSVGFLWFYGTTTRSLLLRNSVITLNLVNPINKINASTITNLTFNAGTSTIINTNSSANAQTFAGGGLTYNNVTVAGAGNYVLTITGNNVFNNFTVDASLANKSIIATGTIQTVNNFKRGSTIGTNVVTMTGGTWTKTDTIPIALDYMNLTNVIAYPVNVWYAGVTPSHSTDNGGNTNWIFTYVDLTGLISTQVATGITMDKNGVTGAVFNGTIAQIDGTPTITISFDYGLNTSYGSSTTTVIVYASGSYIANPVTTLTPGQTYHYRFVGTNSNGITNGNDESFVFTMPDIVTNDATNIESTKVVLNGNVSDMGVATNSYIYFEYGLTNAYGTSTPQVTISTIGNYSTNLTGLTGLGLYYYRMNVVNGVTTSNGSAKTVLLAYAYNVQTNTFANLLLPLIFIVIMIIFVLKLISDGSVIQGMFLLLVVILIGLGLLSSMQVTLNGL
jgi:hypothetical protein